MNSQALKKFFDIILKGESKTYDDHNYYIIGGKLKGYIKGSYGTRYPLLNKDLSQYTIGEVKMFQANRRDAVGQLWATGRYQIIPKTLIGVAKSGGFPDSAIYSPENQDKMAYVIMTERKNLRDYIKGISEDNIKNLQEASLDMAKIWSSIGVPYDMKGAKMKIKKNQSYYSGGGDRASVKTEDVQAALKELRAAGGGSINNYDINTNADIANSQRINDEEKKNNLWMILGIILLVSVGTLGIIFRKKLTNFIRLNY